MDECIKKVDNKDEWIKKIHTYTDNEILSAMRKKEIQFAIWTMWMDLKGTMLSEISLTEKNK